MPILHQQSIVSVPILNNMADKDYEPEVIEETPFPQRTPQVVDTVSEGGKNNDYQPGTTKEKTFPIKRFAVELLSTALNTRSRKILEQFELQQSGGFQIGNFQEGVSGDTRITPNGIVMRNKAGLTTLAQDGDTGDAIFAGQVRAGSTIVSDTIVTEKASSGNGRTVYYKKELPVIVIGDPS